jgi:hypothetical protein
MMSTGIGKMPMPLSGCGDRASPNVAAALCCRALLDPRTSGANLHLVNRPVRVTPLPNARLSVVFSDGIEGVIDMSSSVGRGVFAPLADPEIFAGVHIGDHGQIAWSDEMEICPDAAYLEVCGRHQPDPVHA